MASYATVSRLLATLGDVYIPEPRNNYALVFSSANRRWESKPMIQASFNKIATSPVVSIEAQHTEEVYEYIVDAGFEATIMRVTVSANGLGSVLITVNGVEAGAASNSYLNQEVQFIQNIPLVAGDVVKFTVKNDSFTNETNSYTVWLYLREEEV